MVEEKDQKDPEEIVLAQILRLNAMIYGLVTGLVLGLGIFICTNWLILNGGEVVGPHLNLLGQFFIGYRVTFVGSLIGFAYGFGFGFLIAYFIARLYNRLVDLKEGQRQGRE
jgi:ABC-type Fe3+ transport system permease subunit